MLINLQGGMYYADKPGKTWINMKKGVKTMSLLDKHAVLTTKEAIKYLKISKPTYLKYIRLGRINAVKAGSGWRVHRSELHRFLKVRNG
jgi:excisionase family DNA binding protein